MPNTGLIEEDTVTVIDTINDDSENGLWILFHELVHSESGIREWSLLHIRICFDFRETTTSMALVVPNWLHDPSFEVDNQR
jgi:hypothetical protein